MQPPYLVVGQVDIGLQAASASPCVVLHSLGMNITSVKLLIDGDDMEQAVEVAGVGRQGMCSRWCALLKQTAAI